MNCRIQTLPTDVVHLIAAGEVIDSVAAVVRELAENAIDAGATRITIGLWLDQWRVRVADNGEGMGWAELQQAALSHSTSKIRDRQDLWQITSLGFRGEALHSLAQLADLEICSRSVQGAEGWQVTYSAQGEPVTMNAIAIAPGTIVTVSNLFGHWLSRRQSLPAPAQQLRAVQLTVQQLALCHPQIMWQVEQADRPWFAIAPGQSAKQTLPQFLREVEPSDLQEVWQGQDLYLLLGLPDRCHRYRPDWIKVAVNGRVVRSPELEQTILGALRRTLPRDRHPVCFLHLYLPPVQVDWNRHPAKTELYLRPIVTVQQQVTEAIATALRLSSTYLPDSLQTSRTRQLIQVAESSSRYGDACDRTSLEVGDDFTTETQRTQRQEEGKAEGEETQNSGKQQQVAVGNSVQYSGGDRSDALMPLKALAQVHNMYILAEHATGVWLIEQHIAHERVLYEALCDRWQLVALEPSVILHQLSPLQVEQLQRIGVEVEPFGEQMWAVRSAPESLAGREDCAAALVELSLGGDLEAALVATACRTAMRNGTPLTLAEMQRLLNQWQRSRNPRTCPHGRPIYLPLEESSLSKFFRRHWVIGKSHGI